ncbi:Fe-S cluster assembly ATPase SufC [Oligoflexia bacterium]|nr:Fe-S cluster assembly ATPase SufC [Oligoflexia bacterium]
MLEINNLSGGVAGQKILKGINLSVKPGEVHAIMGVNGSGKSTLANILAGRDGYEVAGGSATFMGKDLLALDTEDRAKEGLFLAFQYPVELPGVLISYFLRTACNSIREHKGEKPFQVREFNALFQEKAKLLELDEDLLKRSVNEGFSGGEKKRNEIFQMAMLDPKLSVLDETDSGLDIDALQIVASGVNTLKQHDPNKAFVVITHYQRLLQYIVPDYVHVMIDGQIIKSGGKELALELEERGYSWVRDEVANSLTK